MRISRHQKPWKTPPGAGHGLGGKSGSGKSDCRERNSCDIEKFTSFMFTKQEALLILAFVGALVIGGIVRECRRPDPAAVIPPAGSRHTHQVPAGFTHNTHNRKSDTDQSRNRHPPKFNVMPKIKFSEGLEKVISKDPRYSREAYIFLKDALDYTIHRTRQGFTRENQHVTPAELLDGIREYALEEFGPAVLMVFDHWNVHCTGDFGNMVFNLVDAGVFGLTEQDRLEDFQDQYDFQEAFVQPFQAQPAGGGK
jgi:uncharacterized repeat protein (TIGR04138 family)